MQTVVYSLPPTLNTIINTARNNRYASAKEKDKWTQEIALLSNDLEPYGETKVWLCFNWKVYNQNRDPDNIVIVSTHFNEKKSGFCQRKAPLTAIQRGALMGYHAKMKKLLFLHS
ncbi:MAG: hypothetical protein F6K17_01450 [Okeania sp. SIO3C4]|nr:hypothetical protein [Okeania sp. SIO3C4]